MSSENLHEDPAVLSNETKDLHRAIVSLMEELEAVDWYQQRAEACTDDELREVLTHNKNEEIEHAMMNLEWIRRRHPKFAENVSTYLNSSGPITEVEEATKEGGPAETDAPEPGPDASGSNSLGIGSLKGK
jgi:ferritin-like protein